MFGLFGSNNNGQWKYDELPTPLKPEDYAKIRELTIKRTLNWVDSNDNWSFFSTVDGVTLESRPVSNSSITVTRGTMTFKCNDFNKFVDHLFESSDESKKKIFEDMEANKIVKELDKDNMIVHSQFRAPPTVSWREFVVLKSRVVLQDGRHIITAVSINDKNVPFTDGYVRGVAISAMVVTNNKDGTIKLVKVEHVDPKGWLPVTLINMLKGKVGKTLAKMPVYL